jgi:hypothetical protein
MSDHSKMTADFKGAIDKTGKLKKAVGPAVRYQLTRFGGLAQKHIMRQVSGGILKTRTGKLRRSIRFNIKLGNNHYYLEIGSHGVVYARILEKGGTITPKNAKFLTIPLPGVKGRASNYPDAFVIKSKKGNLLLVQKKGRSGIVPLFVLKKSVKIPDFWWLKGSMEEKRMTLDRMLQARELLRIAERL